jgi:hypothetical protein
MIVVIRIGRMYSKIFHLFTSEKKNIARGISTKNGIDVCFESIPAQNKNG